MKGKIDIYKASAVFGKDFQADRRVYKNALFR